MEMITWMGKCIHNLKNNNKTGISYGLVGELVQYGSVNGGYAYEHFKVVWCEEAVPRQWKKGLI